MSQLIELTSATWTEIPMVKAAVIRHKSGSGEVLYSQSVVQPPSDLALVQVFEESTVGEKIIIDGVIDGVSLWAYAVRGSCKISVTDIESKAMPNGAFSGSRALTTQSYSEARKKLGSEWEASRRITGVGSGDKLYSVIRVGANHPIDLQSRVLGATGEGVIGRIYELQVSDVVSYGASDVWYNMRFDLANPATYQPEAGLYPESEITFSGGQSAEDFAILANKRGADLILQTNSQNNAKGSVAVPIGSDRIIYQDSIVLLEIESLDSQDISARLEIFEGELDLPILE